MEEGSDTADAIGKYTYGYLRRFGLGVLRMSPADFGKMVVGDFLDTMGGYYEQKYEDHKFIANLVRTATTFLVNNPRKESEQYLPKELWKMPWDEEESKPVVVTKEEYEKRIKQAEEFFKRTVNGNSNK